MAKTPGDAQLGGAGAHLMEFSQQMQQREAQEPRGPAKVIQLPLWPEPKRGAPNAALRSALFAAIQGKGRRYMDREVLAAQRGVTVRFTGKQLDQADLDVWEQTLHLARTQALGTRCRFTEKGFLKALGRQSGKSGRDWLRSVLCSAGRCGGRTHPRSPDLRRDAAGVLPGRGHWPHRLGDQSQACTVLRPDPLDAD